MIIIIKEKNNNNKRICIAPQGLTLEALGPGSVLLRKGREKAREKRNVISLDLNTITDSFQ